MQQKRSHSPLFPWFLCFLLLCACAVCVFCLYRHQQTILLLQTDLALSSARQSEVDSLTAEQTTLLATCETLRQERANLEEDLSRAIQANQELIDELTASAQKSRTLEAELSQTAADLAGYREQNPNLEQYVVSLEGILESYAADPGVEERLDVIADLQNRLAQSETESGKLRIRVAELEEQLTNAEQSYAGAYALMQENTVAAESASDAAEQLEIECEQLRSQLAVTQSQLDETSAALETACIDLTESQTQLLQAQNSCAAMSEELLSNDTAMNAYEEDIRALHEDIAALQTILSETEQYAAGRDSLLEEARAALEGLAEENESLLAQIDALAASSILPEENGQEYLAQIARLEAQLARMPATQQTMELDLTRRRLEWLEQWKADMIAWLEDLRNQKQIEALMPITDPVSGLTTDPVQVPPVHR